MKYILQCKNAHDLGFQMVNISEARKNQITKVRFLLFSDSKQNTYIKPNSHYQKSVATYMKLWAKFYTQSIQLNRLLM